MLISDCSIGAAGVRTGIEDAGSPGETGAGHRSLSSDRGSFVYRNLPVFPDNCKPTYGFEERLVHSLNVSRLADGLDFDSTMDQTLGGIPFARSPGSQPSIDGIRDDTKFDAGIEYVKIRS
jgi:hypothetical protein